MNVLLHACCGPCSLEPCRLLAAQGHDLVLAYCNPNIHPADEYIRRRDTLLGWAAIEGLQVVELDYDPELWEQVVGAFGTDRKSRCRACYRLRFERVAHMAAVRGFDAVSTTLSVSPYQYTDVIAEELRRAARDAGVEALFEDFRPAYREATRRSRQLGMYRQNYCGCRFSIAEAAASRAARDSARVASKAARREAHEAAERYCAALEAARDAQAAVSRGRRGSRASRRKEPAC